MPLPSPSRTGVQDSVPARDRCPTRELPALAPASSAVIHRPPAPSGASRAVSARHPVVVLVHRLPLKWTMTSGPSPARGSRWFPAAHTPPPGRASTASRVSPASAGLPAPARCQERPS
ncbi:MAG TPA: hypothetical protein VK586_26270 [Streptosporangiaceae bacterium]|nr:hypothetical protein [Streptosporangiaceae bacterium]